MNWDQVTGDLIKARLLERSVRDAWMCAMLWRYDWRTCLAFYLLELQK